MEILNLILGFIFGFMICLRLWFWIEQRNAKRENESKK